ncbi:MAG: STAS domain-containing protein [Gemmatimonadetes bacterium]|nr:MAG: STAS domain-containing protein [Gemmatimonadota bacterium]
MERIPIIKIEGMLVISVQTDLHDKLALQLQEDILNHIQDTGARGILIDLSAIDIVDSFMGRVLSDTAHMARILGATTVIVGIQPEVAITLVELGLDLQGVHVALNADRGMDLLRQLQREGF